MPWEDKDAKRHTRKATSARLRKIWREEANRDLAKGGSEGRAIRKANAAVRMVSQRSAARKSSR